MSKLIICVPRKHVSSLFCLFVFYLQTEKQPGESLLCQNSMVELWKKWRESKKGLVFPTIEVTFMGVRLRHTWVTTNPLYICHAYAVGLSMGWVRYISCVRVRALGMCMYVEMEVFGYNCLSCCKCTMVARWRSIRTGLQTWVGWLYKHVAWADTLTIYHLKPPAQLSPNQRVSLWLALEKG